MNTWMLVRKSEEKKPARDCLRQTKNIFTYFYRNGGAITFKLSGCVSNESEKSIESSENNWFDFCAY